MRSRHRNRQPSGRPNRRSRRRLPELAAVLWAAFIVVTLLWTLPGLGVLPVTLALPPLLAARWLALILVTVLVAVLVALLLDAAWMRLRRRRIRRRRRDVGTVEIPPRGDRSC